jgi:uncharacterized FAD-dependent dehydrogenase
MKYIVQNIKCGIDTDDRQVLEYAVKKAGIAKSAVLSWRILKKSIDARNKDDIRFVFSVLLETSNNVRVKNRIDIKPYEESKVSDIKIGNTRLQDPPVIVGSGPCGLFAGFLLARHGYRPVIIEQGGPVEERVLKVKEYWNTGKLDIKSNVQFGEGGAGTFSDGKLTTGIVDPWCDYVLEQFVRFGAPKEILYLSKPHIGTDLLRGLLVRMRNEIIRLGGSFSFHTEMKDLVLRNDKVCGIKTTRGDIPCEILVLAIGHSARDTFQMLLLKGIQITQKPMAVGVRVEHKQSFISESRYGAYARMLPPADYKLACKIKDRGVYSFCMCPGGTVVAAASEENTVVTNGMSYYARDLDNANAALVVSVDPKDYPSDHPLAGVEFQRRMEKAAFAAGLGKAPAQTVKDFLEGKRTYQFGTVTPSYTGGVEPGSVEECLPLDIASSLKEGLLVFDKQIPGFIQNDAVLTGVETRTSSPVRILRNDSFHCLGFFGILPGGEGAGYAGGIMSAAVDGLRIAESIIRQYSPFL